MHKRSVLCGPTFISRNGNLHDFDHVLDELLSNKKIKYLGYRHVSVPRKSIYSTHICCYISTSNANIYRLLDLYGDIFCGDKIVLVVFS